MNTLTRLVYVLFIFLMINFISLAQTKEWTWMHGDSIPNVIGRYGTMGVANSNNRPGSRFGAVNWTDKNGNLWLFGGYGFAINSSIDKLNDLWKYNPGTNQWTWINGDNFTGSFSVYGTQGITLPSNKPGARYNAAAWIDTTGIFWLFGGIGEGETVSNAGWLSDLWNYNPITNEWTWVKGNKGGNYPGIYGIKGVANPNNMPGGRHERPATWIDKNNNLWLFGGCGYDSAGNWNCLNDLWKYDIAINEWTWMGGNTLVNHFGIYGTLGENDSSNYPGCRMTATSATDKNGNFWLMAGGGFANSGNGYLNDLWKYEPLIDEWTWTSGDSSLYNPGIYGTIGISSSSNKPGCRNEAGSWIDNNGNFWLFGGFGYGSTATVGGLNDLWKFNPLNNEWTWMNGAKITGDTNIYGIKGISNALNHPGNRGYAAYWKDNQGCFWLFGGWSWVINSDYFNDLWKYCPDSTSSIEDFNMCRFSINVFPNPLHDYSIVQINSNINLKNAVLKFYNVFGQEIKRIDVFTNIIKLEKGNLSRGVYILRLTNQSSIIGNAKIIIE